ncbi:hypothetical protein [Actinomadura physcomitrii]|uniref:hypothetical protein n=1 Tax=Actinomadura physcomitrii TaxID=2650748 RepID=UPI00136EA75F|nr:hypothetical protein [Actinomadura physcomitrii]
MAATVIAAILERSGLPVTTTGLQVMPRRDARYGPETMCIGGGEGLAAIFTKGWFPSSADKTRSRPRLGRSTSP